MCAFRMLWGMKAVAENVDSNVARKNNNSPSERMGNVTDNKYLPSSSIFGEANEFAFLWCTHAFTPHTQPEQQQQERLQLKNCINLHTHRYTGEHKIKLLS